MNSASIGNEYQKNCVRKGGYEQYKQIDTLLQVQVKRDRIIAGYLCHPGRTFSDSLSRLFVGICAPSWWPHGHVETRCWRKLDGGLRDYQRVKWTATTINRAERAILIGSDILFIVLATDTGPERCPIRRQISMEVAEYISTRRCVSCRWKNRVMP